MNKSDIKKTEKYFVKYTEGIYRAPDYFSSETCKKYYHKKEDYFHIAIFEGGDVYQLNNDGEVQGIELNTIEELKVRYKSFTGEELENIK